nr:MAG TPA: hypothetical protein [Caudoviricetes sp.]
MLLFCCQNRNLLKKSYFCVTFGAFVLLLVLF